MPDELLKSINERINSKVASQRATVFTPLRQPQPTLLREGAAQVPSVESPLLCILAGSSILWKLEPGTDPVYPVHVHDSLYNTDMGFDAGEFK